MLFREIRTLEDRFGLSTVSRRRLGWDVSREPVTAANGSGGGDDRSLRV
jgi:hypothetical protein